MSTYKKDFNALAKRNRKSTQVRKCELANTNLRTRTCDEWPNGIASRRRYDASSKQAISVQPCTRACTKETKYWSYLRRLELGDQTLKTLRSLAWTFELDQSGRKSLQAIVSPRKPGPNGVTLVTISLQLAITCDSVSIWSGPIQLCSQKGESQVITPCEPTGFLRSQINILFRNQAVTHDKSGVKNKNVTIWNLYLKELILQR